MSADSLLYAAIAFVVLGFVGVIAWELLRAVREAWDEQVEADDE